MLETEPRRHDRGPEADVRGQRVHPRAQVVAAEGAPTAIVRVLLEPFDGSKLPIGL